MAKSDFTKTGAQVERELIDLIDSVDRSLDHSTGESERKGQIVLTAFLSIIVFLSVLAFEHLVGAKARSVQDASGGVPNMHKVIAPKDFMLVSSYLDRVETNVSGILEVKNRVAPSMMIDGQIRAINDSVSDIRRVLNPEPTANKPASD